MLSVAVAGLGLDIFAVRCGRPLSGLVVVKCSGQPTVSDCGKTISPTPIQNLRHVRSQFVRDGHRFPLQRSELDVEPSGVVILERELDWLRLQTTGGFDAGRRLPDRERGFNLANSGADEYQRVAAQTGIFDGVSCHWQA